TPEGEFTGTLRGPAHAPLADTPTAPPESGAHPETGTGGGDAPVSNEPGEFTRMFGAVSPKEAPAADSSRMVSPEPDAIAEGSAPPPDASASDEPGEFTRIFGAVSPEGAPTADSPST